MKKQDIMEFVTGCIAQAESDGFQQGEGFNFGDDVTEWFWNDKGIFFIAKDGSRFVLELHKGRKPK